jgi:hypothetical protein
LRSSGNGDTPSPLKVKKSLVTKDSQGTKDGLLVGAEHGSHVFGQRKALAWTCLALCDCQVAAEIRQSSAPMLRRAICRCCRSTAIPNCCWRSFSKSYFLAADEQIGTYRQ